MKLSTLELIMFVLLIVGGLNWAFYAFDFNLVSLLFGFLPMLEKLVYILVGVAALYIAMNLTKYGKEG